ncbi:Argonaute-like protein [Mycena chlorophos]|uniref:Argonaute-like protein n=1 Tax=Mycena chlorophos TaxID=658473 RepID=A0A8H6SAK9_MYCCL|nr:Argonaute-like protein [Mycena chlorophos]
MPPRKKGKGKAAGKTTASIAGGGATAAGASTRSGPAAQTGSNLPTPSPETPAAASSAAAEDQPTPVGGSASTATTTTAVSTAATPVVANPTPAVVAPGVAQRVLIFDRSESRFQYQVEVMRVVTPVAMATPAAPRAPPPARSAWGAPRAPMATSKTQRPPKLERIDSQVANQVIQYLREQAQPEIFEDTIYESNEDGNAKVLYAEAPLTLPEGGLFEVEMPRVEGDAETAQEPQPAGYQQQRHDNAAGNFQVKITLITRAVAASHVKGTGVRRPGDGRSGMRRNVIINAVRANVSTGAIYHYDVITPTTNKDARLRLIEGFRRAAPNVFGGKRPAYDGNKILYSAVELRFPHGGSSIEHTLPDPGRPVLPNRPPTQFTVKITLARTTMGTSTLQEFVKGKIEEDEELSTAIMGLNSSLKMIPFERHHPVQGRSFFTDYKARQIGGGVEIWSGIFQSLRPTLGHMLVNVDVSSAPMYKAGSLIDLCQSFLDMGNPFERTVSNATQLAAVLLGNDQRAARTRGYLEYFLQGLHIQARVAAGTGPLRTYTVKSVSNRRADQHMFQTHAGATISIAQYYFQASNSPLAQPGLPCIGVGSNGAFIPLEKCIVPPGQFMRKDVLDGLIKAKALKTKPHERLEIIKASIQQLDYAQSQYLADFGIEVETQLITAPARVLKAPTITYWNNLRQTPKDGAWNMADKKFFQPATISYVVVVSCVRINQQTMIDMARDLITGCETYGIRLVEKHPYHDSANIHHPDPDLIARLSTIKMAVQNQQIYRQLNHAQALFVVILPDNQNSQLYTQVKFWGNSQVGVATQCLKASKCQRANQQYWANVALKINNKRGGVNAILSDSPTEVGSNIPDPHLSTVVLGADVSHPPASVKGPPSFAAVVSTVDKNLAKYVATMRMQHGRQEIISELGQMVQDILRQYMEYQQKVHQLTAGPQRLVFYRDGVSESQFRQVIDQELPLIKGRLGACTALGINPKITLIVVGKRHHIRFFPVKPSEADRSGNAVAGTVIDTTITHPFIHDFYLLSHAGILGTSRPAHYSVLYDPQFTMLMGEDPEEMLRILEPHFKNVHPSVRNFSYFA